MPTFVMSTGGTRTYTWTLSASGSPGGSVDWTIARCRFVNVNVTPIGRPIDDPPDLEAHVQIQFWSGIDAGPWIDLGPGSSVSGSVTFTHSTRRVLEENPLPGAAGSTPVWGVHGRDEYNLLTTTIVLGGRTETRTTDPSGTAGQFVTLSNAHGVNLAVGQNTQNGAVGAAQGGSTTGSLGFTCFPVEVATTGVFSDVVNDPANLASWTRTCEATTSLLTGTVTATVSPAQTGFGTAVGLFCNAQVKPSRSLAFNVAIKQLELPFSGSLEGAIENRGVLNHNPTWTTFSGSATLTQTLRHYALNANGLVNAPPTVPEGPLRPIYRRAGVTTERRQVGILGTAFSAFSLAHAGNATVDDGASLTPVGDWAGRWQGLFDAPPPFGTPNNPITLSIASGSVSCTVPAGAVNARLQRIFYAPLTYNTFLRWTRLRVRVRSTAGPHDVNFRFGGKTWKKQTGAANAFTDIDIDLSAEDPGPRKWSYVDNETQSERDGAFDYGAAYYGGGGGLELQGLVAGETYEVDSVQLLLPVSGQAFSHECNDHTGYFPRVDPNPIRALVIDGEGQHMLSLPVYPNPPSVSGAEYANNLVNKVNVPSERAWTATDSTAPPVSIPGYAGYYNAAGLTSSALCPSLFIGGGGRTLRFGNGAVAFSVPGSIGIQAAHVAYAIRQDWHDSPMGPFGTSSYNCVEIDNDRNAPWGRVLNQDGTPAAGVSVTLHDPSGAAIPGTSATTGSNGQYFLQAPSQDTPNLYVRVGGWQESANWLQGLLGRHRLVLRRFVIPPIGGPSVDTNEQGLTMYAATSQGELLIGRSQNWKTNLWEEEKPGITGTDPAISFLKGSSGGRVAILYGASGGVLPWIYSDDLGETWSVATTIWASGATRGALESHPSGWQMAAARMSSGSIEVKGVDRAGTVLWGPVVALASGSADERVDLTHDASARRWYLLYSASSGGGITSLESADDGKTWT